MHTQVHTMVSGQMLPTMRAEYPRLHFVADRALMEGLAAGGDVGCLPADLLQACYQGLHSIVCLPDDAAAVQVCMCVCFFSLTLLLSSCVLSLCRCVSDHSVCTRVRLLGWRQVVQAGLQKKPGNPCDASAYVPAACLLTI